MKDEDELIPTRQSLLGRLKDWDDQESWKVFFDTYWRLIYSAARRAGLTDTEAQDVVQETILSVLKSMADFKYRTSNGSFKSWLLQLTSWRICDQLRRRKHHWENPREDDASERTDAIEKMVDPASLDWQEAWDTDWETNVMQAAVQRVKKRVDAKAYQVFDLLVFKEWQTMRVAQALKMSRAHVYIIKHRVSKLLKEEVTQIRKEQQFKTWGLKAAPH